MTFEQLIQENCKPTYADLLATEEWAARRVTILERDDHKCTACQTGRTERLWAGYGYKNFYFSSQEMQEDKPVELGREKQAQLVVSALENPIFLHVHHHYYMKTCLPWDYSDDALTTLCDACHKHFHLNNHVPYYDFNSVEGQRIQIAELKPCNRCGGTGMLDQYKHVNNGICFGCNGTGGYEKVFADMEF